MNRNAGLTLIELTVALAIVSLLTMAALAVVANVTRGQGAQKQRDEEYARALALRELLWRDVLQATSYSITETGVALNTYSSVGPETLEPRHLAAVVEYRVRKIGPRSWVQRVQRGRTAGEDLIELVCEGVKSVTMTTDEPHQVVVNEWRPTSDMAMVIIEFAAPGREPEVHLIRRN